MKDSKKFKKYYDACADMNGFLETSMNKVSRDIGYLSFDMGPVKEYEKALHKYTYKKGKEIHRTNDIIRGSFWSDSLLTHYHIINYLASKEQQDWCIHEIRDSHFPVFTNGFTANFDYKEVFFPRLHRDLKVIVKKNNREKNELPIYAELQMHLLGFEDINKKTHDLYDKERGLTRKLYLESEYFSEEDFFVFLDTRLETISLNEKTVRQYNMQSAQNNEEIQLLPGKDVIQNMADKNKILYDEQVLNMLTKGLLPKKHPFSIPVVKKKYENELLKRMEETLENTM